MNIPIAAPSLLVLFSWYADWLWGLPLIALTAVFHASGLLLISEKLERIQKHVVERYGYRVEFVVSVGGSAMWAAVLHGTEATIWGGAYLYIGAMPDFHTAVLYSLGAMTTYGHANLLLEERWQLLGSLEALDGLLLFGLTTAFLIGIIQKSHELKSPRAR